MRAHLDDDSGASGELELGLEVVGVTVKFDPVVDDDGLPDVEFDLSSNEHLALVRTSRARAIEYCIVLYCIL